MVSNPIRQALILAHQSRADGTPEALLRTGGVPQLKRLLMGFKRGGLKRFVVVAGGHGAALRALVSGDAQLRGLDVVWVDALDAHSAGDATLSARPHLRGDFFLCQADHVFAPSMLGTLSEEPLDGVTLAVARTWLPSQSGALGLQLRAGGRVGEVGELAHPDARWTGLATCDPTLFDVLQELRDTGAGVDLVRAFAYLASVGCARVADVGNDYWHEVRTPAGLRQAHRLLLASLRKPEVDGVIARNINRYFSLFITRLLMGLPVKPNHVTFVTLLVSIASGIVGAMASPGQPWLLGAGGALWQLASMLDGTDGEIARLKFQGSKAGEWFDTVVDDLGRAFAFLGMGFGLTNVTGQAFWAQFMVLTVILQSVVTLKIYRQLIQIGAGSHFALAWTKDVERPVNQTLFSRFWSRIEFMCRRDYYIFMFMLLCIAGFAWLAAILSCATTLIVVGHELAWPRQARDRQVASTILVRDQQRA